MKADHLIRCWWYCSNHKPFISWCFGRWQMSLSAHWLALGIRSSLKVDTAHRYGWCASSKTIQRTDNGAGSHSTDMVFISGLCFTCRTQSHINVLLRTVSHWLLGFISRVSLNDLVLPHHVLWSLARRQLTRGLVVRSCCHSVFCLKHVWRCCWRFPDVWRNSGTWWKKMISVCCLPQTSQDETACLWLFILKV